MTGDEAVAALQRSFKFVHQAQEAEEGMIMIDTHTFAVVLSMAALWAGSNGH